MKQFNDYITEKIDRMEFEWAISPNANVQGGAEFEFIIDEEHINSNTENLEDEWKTLVSRMEDDIDTYNREVEEYEEEKDELQNLIEKNKDKIIDLEEEMDKEGISDEREDEIIKKIDKLTVDNDYSETEYDEYEMPFIEKYNYANILQFLNDNSGYDGDEWDEIIQDNFGEKLYLSNFGLYYNLSDMVELGDGSVDYEDFIDNSDAPFKDEDYDYDYKSSTAWNIEDDPSLSVNSVEITSPVKQVHELLNDIEDMFFWIDDVGTTDSTCGFHVHMSTVKKKEFDPIKLLMFVEENSILKHFEERRNSKWAKSIYFLKQDYYTEKDLLKILNKKDILKELKNKEKYMGVHIIDLEDNHVEFRYMGAGGYHTKFKEVKENIAKYVHWMEVATNPEYKRKEYLKKTNSVLNKLKLNFLDGFFNYIQDYDDIWQKKMTKKLKPFKKTYDMLKRTYKMGIGKTPTTDDYREFLKTL